MHNIITSIRKIGIEHSKWFGYATAMIDNISVDEKKVSMNLEKCKFGQWYKLDEWALSIYPEYRNIEKHHKKAHKLFNQMISISNHKQKLSFFSKMTSSSQKLSKSNQKLLSRLYTEFKQESTSILSLLNKLQTKVKENQSQDNKETQALSNSLVA